MLTAEIETAEAGKDAGTVYTPDVEIVPKLEFPPKIPLTNQFTEEFVDPVTAALNDCVWPAARVTVDGFTVTATEPLVRFLEGSDVSADVAFEVAPQPVRTARLRVRPTTTRIVRAEFAGTATMPPGPLLLKRTQP